MPTKEARWLETAFGLKQWQAAQAIASTSQYFITHTAHHGNAPVSSPTLFQVTALPWWTNVYVNAAWMGSIANAGALFVAGGTNCFAFSKGHSPPHCFAFDGDGWKEWCGSYVEKGEAKQWMPANRHGKKSLSEKANCWWWRGEEK